MTPEYILKMSLCRAPFCNGPFKLRETTFKDWPEADRAAAILAAESEIDCMQYAKEYAESGYTNPTKGILFANWNRFPREIVDILERYGFELEWSDEWTLCDGCYKAMRTSADSYGWQPSGTLCNNNGESYCLECLTEDDIRELEGNSNRAVNIAGINLAAMGYVEIECGFESGWHTGQNDNPVTIATALNAAGYANLLFQVSDTGQFDIGFCVWHRPELGKCHCGIEPYCAYGCSAGEAN